MRPASPASMTSPTEPSKIEGLHTSTRPGEPARAATFFYLGLALLVTLTCLLYWAHTLRAQLFWWEEHVARQIAQRMDSPERWSGLWRDCLLWEAHLVSQSERSLFYAPLATAVTGLWGFNTWTIRTPSMLWLLGFQVLLFVFVRRSYSTTAALGACLFVALSPFALLPGVMGFSVTASRFAALVALAATVWLLTTMRQRAFDGALAALALYLATVQYAPARLLVLICLVVAIPTLAIRARKLERLPLLRLLGLLVVVGAVVGIQASAGRLGRYVDSGGETLVQLSVDRSYVRSTIGLDIEQGSLSLSAMARVAAFQVRKNLPDLLFYINPDPRRLPVDETVVTSPPRVRLVLVWFLPLVLLGAARAVRRWREPPSSVLLLYTATLLPFALTCSFLRAFRVDLLVLPTAVWCGVGVDRVVALLRGWPPRWVGHLVATAVIAALACYTAGYLGWPGNRVEPQEATRTLATWVRSARSDTVISAQIENQFLSYLSLVAMDRLRERPGVIVDVVSPDELKQGGLDRLLDAFRGRPRRDVTVVLLPPGPDRVVTEEMLARLGRAQRLVDAGPMPCRVVELEWPP